MKPILPFVCPDIAEYLQSIQDINECADVWLVKVFVVSDVTNKAFAEAMQSSFATNLTAAERRKVEQVLGRKAVLYRVKSGGLRHLSKTLDAHKVEPPSSEN